MTNPGPNLTKISIPAGLNIFYQTQIPVVICPVLVFGVLFVDVNVAEKCLTLNPIDDKPVQRHRDGKQNVWRLWISKMSDPLFNYPHGKQRSTITFIGSALYD